VAFAAIAGIPTIMILVLPVLYGGLRDGDKASALAAVIMVLAYVAISARSNLKSAQALQQARVELRRFTFLDPLTALTNRRGFVDELGKRVTGANLRLSSFGLVRIDLNRLQDVNETIGHDAGDALLFASAQRLRAVTGPAASLSRTGGDDFALILGADIDETQGKRLCADILEAFTQPIAVKGVTVTVTPNIAVAWFPQDADDAEGLIKAADAALEEAQNAGRDPWRATASAA
jgi:diguanylate cyclase (GGDEF)-like protein